MAKKKKIKKRKLCALYGRVSTDRQARVDHGGLDTQFDQMERQIKLNQDLNPDIEWVIVDRYRDEGKSGKDFNRPEFQRMMRDVEAGRINTVVAAKFDRLSRAGILDFYRLLERLNELGTDCISIKEQFDTSSASGRAFMGVHMIFAQYERELTAERTADTMAHRAREGLFNGGHVPFGYKVDPNHKGHLVINEDEADLLLHDVYEKCVELGSAGKVHKHLREKGIVSPKTVSRRGKAHGGTPYCKPAVINMLTNPVYVGRVSHHGKTYNGVHSPIIPQELFDQVQDILGKNRLRPPIAPEERKHEYLLQGLIRCGQCGSMMTPRSSTGRNGLHHYYNCTKQNVSAGYDCDARYVPAIAAEEFVIDLLKQAVLDEEEMQRVVKKANKLRSKTLKTLDRDISRTRKALQDIKAKITPIVQAIENGADVGPLRDRLRDLSEDEKQQKAELERLQEKKVATEEKLLSAEVITESYKNVPDIVDGLVKQGKWKRLRAILQQYIELIEWHWDEKDKNKGTMRVHLYEHANPVESEHKTKKPDALVNDGASDCKDWLPRTDSNRRPSG